MLGSTGNYAKLVGTRYSQNACKLKDKKGISMSEEDKYGLKMLDIDDEARGILAYSIDGGSISKDAAAPIWERLDKAKAHNKKIRLYAEMSALPKASGALVMDKLKRLGAIFTTIDKMAIVGDSGWMDVYAKIVDPITTFDVRHFPTEQKDEALTWILE